MFQRILIPLDGSPRAEAILSQVARLLNRRDSEVVLLRAVYMPASVAGRLDTAAIIKREREEAFRYVKDLAKRFADQGANVRGRIVEGPPAESILKVAREEGATMIAMTTHGRTGLARWFLGSVTEKVLRLSDVPVLLVRSFRRSLQGELEPVSLEEISFRRILVPTDGSETAMTIVPAASLFALLFGAEVAVLHVESPVLPQGAILPGMEAGVPLPVLAPTAANEDPATAKMAKRFTQAGLKVTRWTTVGDAPSEIIDRSFASGIDLIAMATHGRSGVSRWLLGSVTERVLRHAGVPMLIVRAPDKAAPKARRPKGSAAGRR